jgi:hypothetical protein
MMKLELFEPALCCSTGVCGPEPDKQLIDLQNVLNLLKKAGVSVERYAINQAPLAFTKNETVKGFIRENGPGKLPLSLLDGEILLAGAYPSLDLLKEKIPALTGITPDSSILGQFS